MILVILLDLIFRFAICKLHFAVQIEFDQNIFYPHLRIAITTVIYGYSIPLGRRRDMGFTTRGKSHILGLRPMEILYIQYKTAYMTSYDPCAYL